jgi:adenine-specific DNA-methyltransferase
MYHEGKMDYWYYFLHRALDISHGTGNIAFITSRYWIASSGSKRLIRRLQNMASFVSILDIGNLTVFENVAGHHMVHIYTKRRTKEDCTIRRLQNNLEDISRDFDTLNLQILRRPSSELFRDDQIHLEPSGVALSASRKLDDFFVVTQGVVQNPDKVSAVAAEKYELPKGAGVFVLTPEELAALRLKSTEMAFVKPFYDEASVQRFSLRLDHKNCLLYLTKKNCHDLSDKPNIRKHLIKYRQIMEQRRETKKGTIEWFQLHWPRDPAYFESEKVILPSMFRNPKAAYVAETAYVGLGSNVIVSKSQSVSLKCLVGILNSSLAGAWFRTNGKHRGVGVDIGVEKLRSFPLPDLGKDHQSPIVVHVERILAEKRRNPEADTTPWEREIDRLVYDLYALTPAEIKLVEENAAK